ncbi:MAG: helix-hairpin-helix domain-containing protein [Nitrospiraceae bacterium]|nr:helix-hairpin-helix domain-containing protein [Nitrospiraceae bacterium]
MDTVEKLRVLSRDSRYDLACACGGSRQEHRRRGADGRWLYPVVLPGGGYTVLLKTLLSNACANDCKYCPLRAEAGFRRCSLGPEEVARLFMEYLRRRMAFGVFLSSAVTGSPDSTMERINGAARILRRKHGFKGYIHLKLIPGASDAAMEESLSLASAVSLNIETPGERHFATLSGKKDFAKDIIRPLGLMGRLTGRGMRYSCVKCTTQFIVGAATETDREIIDYVYRLYGGMNFKRVYFSAYQKGAGAPDIPGERRAEALPNEVFIREHRLYQADFLARRYGFTKDEFIFAPGGNLRLDKDPKEAWAEAHPEYFPVRLNTSAREELLRVPGLGPETVKCIVAARQGGKIRSPEDLGLKGKRLQKAMKYLVCE